MNIRELNELLNKACEIIVSLEKYADDDLKEEINDLFNIVTINNELDNEMRNYSADDEAQDWEVFGKKKI